MTRANVFAIVEAQIVKTAIGDIGKSTQTLTKTVLKFVEKLIITESQSALTGLWGGAPD